MSLLRDWLNDGPLLTDGAWGTQLQALGLEPGMCPDIWNIDRPEAVGEVAKAYVDAGSRVILTNTFRANPISLPEEWRSRAAEINAAGVRISKKAADGRALVFASIGPCGKVVVAGEISEPEVKAAYNVQAEALAGAGADALLIETQGDIEEAEILLRCCRRTGLPVVVSFTFDAGKAHDRTMTGATPERAARAMEQLGADAIGANCGTGVENFIPICRRLHEASQLPVWIKANAGLPVMEGGELRYRDTPEAFAAYLPALLSAGASFVGGCCGTNPAYISALRNCLISCASE
jgi:methionine synthase I (cobalamin-dependent)